MQTDHERLTKEKNVLYLLTVPLRYNVALARDIFLDSRSHHARLVSSVQAYYQKVALRFVYN